MRKKTGRIDYSSGCEPLHPFYTGKSSQPRKMIIDYYKITSRWKLITKVIFIIIICNTLMSFLLLSKKSPVLFIDTVLNTGEFYEKGVFNQKPLDKHQSLRLLHKHSDSEKVKEK